MNHLITYYHLLTVEVQNDFNEIRSIEGQLPILSADSEDSSFFIYYSRKREKEQYKSNPKTL